MKVAYHIGKRVGKDISLEKGNLKKTRDGWMLTGLTESILLDQMVLVEGYQTKDAGPYIKIINRAKTIFLTVPKIHLNLGSGLILVNAGKTMDLKKQLEEEKIKKNQEVES